MNKKIRIGSISYYLQEEGLHAGTPSVFIRTWGCNFTCPSFSMPLGQRSNERFLIHSTDYKNYNDLPPVKTGCDSYQDWDNRFKHLSHVISIDKTISEIDNVLHGRKFNKNLHLVLTGGEPLLGQKKQHFYIELFRKILKMHLVEDNKLYVTIETNGTQKLTQELSDYLRYESEVSVTFSISPKLSSSGVAFRYSIIPEIIWDLNIPADDLYLKFVASSNDDVQEIYTALKVYQEYNKTIIVYIMPTGGTLEQYNKNREWVETICKENSWRCSRRSFYRG